MGKSKAKNKNKARAKKQPAAPGAAVAPISPQSGPVSPSPEPNAGAVPQSQASGAAVAAAVHAAEAVERNLSELEEHGGLVPTKDPLEATVDDAQDTVDPAPSEETDDPRAPLLHSQDSANLIRHEIISTDSATLASEEAGDDDEGDTRFWQELAKPQADSADVAPARDSEIHERESQHTERAETSVAPDVTPDNEASIVSPVVELEAEFVPKAAELPAPSDLKTVTEYESTSTDSEIKGDSSSIRHQLSQPVAENTHTLREKIIGEVETIIDSDNVVTQDGLSASHTENDDFLASLGPVQDDDSGEKVQPTAEKEPSMFNDDNFLELLDKNAGSVTKNQVISEGTVNDLALSTGDDEFLQSLQRSEGGNDSPSEPALNGESSFLQNLGTELPEPTKSETDPGDDDFLSSLEAAQNTASKEAFSTELTLELDDDFLDEEVEMDPSFANLQTQATSGSEPARGLDFLDMEEDLLPEDAPVFEETDVAAAPVQETPIEETASESTKNPLMRLRGKPSMQAFRTGETGFDLPTELIPKRPVLHHSYTIVSPPPQTPGRPTSNFATTSPAAATISPPARPGTVPASNPYAQPVSVATAGSQMGTDLIPPSARPLPGPPPRAKGPARAQSVSSMRSKYAPGTQPTPAAASFAPPGPSQWGGSMPPSAPAITNPPAVHSPLRGQAGMGTLPPAGIQPASRPGNTVPDPYGFPGMQPMQPPRPMRAVSRIPSGNSASYAPPAQLKQVPHQTINAEGAYTNPPSVAGPPRVHPPSFGPGNRDAPHMRAAAPSSVPPALTGVNGHHVAPSLRSGNPQGSPVLDSPIRQSPQSPQRPPQRAPQPVAHHQVQPVQPVQPPRPSVETANVHQPGRFLQEPIGNLEHHQHGHPNERQHEHHPYEITRTATGIESYEDDPLSPFGQSGTREQPAVSDFAPMQQSDLEINSLLGGEDSNDWDPESSVFAPVVHDNHEEYHNQLPGETGSGFNGSEVSSSEAFAAQLPAPVPVPSVPEAPLPEAIPDAAQVPYGLQQPPQVSRRSSANAYHGPPGPRPAASRTARVSSLPPSRAESRQSGSRTYTPQPQTHEQAPFAAQPVPVPMPLPHQTFSQGPPKGPTQGSMPASGDPMTDLLQRQRPLFVWSARSAVLVTPSFGYGGVYATNVEIRDLQAVAREPLVSAVSAHFPSALFNSKGAIAKNKRKDVEKWLEERVKEAPPPLLYGLMRELLKPVEVRQLAKVLPAEQGLLSASEFVVPQSSVDVSSLMARLIEGDSAGAVQTALDARSWATALVIAQAAGPEAWSSAVAEFVREETRRSSRELAFLLRILSSSTESEGAEAVTAELRPRGTTQLVDYDALDTILAGWARYAALVVANTRPNSPVARGALMALGKLLLERGSIEGGHVCLILSGAPLFGDPLQGFAAPLISSFDGPWPLEAVELAEVYEYVLGVPLPHVLTLKVVHAGWLADAGYASDATRLAESAIQQCRQVERKPSSPAAAQMASLAAYVAEQLLSRLSTSTRASGEEGWFSRKLSRPNLGEAWKSSFNKFVSGEAEPVEPPRSRPGSAAPILAAGLAASAAMPPHAPRTPVDAVHEGSAVSGYFGAISPGSTAGGAPQADMGAWPHPQALQQQQHVPLPQHPLQQPLMQAGHRGSDQHWGYEPSSYEAPSERTSYEPPSSYVPQMPQPPQPLQQQHEAQAPMPPQPPQAQEPLAAEQHSETQASWKPAPTDDDLDDDLGIANNSSKAAKVGAESKPVESSAKDEKKGWFGWLRRNGTDDAPKPIKAKLGEESQFYYDPERKRWINKSGPPPEDKPPPPPPPPRSMPPSRSASGAGTSFATPSQGAPPPGAPPPGPPSGPPAISSSGPATGPPTGPPMLPRKSVAGDIDSLLGDGAATVPATRRKRNARARYVDVLQQK